MSLNEFLIGEIERESVATRKCLVRLPEDKLAWKPAEKSMTLGQLAFHIAAVPGGIFQALESDTFEVPQFTAPQPQDKAEILAALEGSLAVQKEKLASWPEEFLYQEFRIMREGQVIMAVPRIGFIRMVGLSHIYHHRGQLSVYLRILGIALPSIYGPSADELPDFLTQAAS